MAPPGPGRIDDPRSVELLRLRVEAPTSRGADLQGAGQTVAGDVFEIRDADGGGAGAPDPEALRLPGPGGLHRERRARDRGRGGEGRRRRAVGPRARAERLVRHVNALLEKKPTVSLPSAREVLRTRVGDCNEHTVLYVAMARALGIPSRIAVGLVYLHGAFYYHAWPEVYVEGPTGRGLWLPVDPTLNQFPADATHVRLARGGLDRQAAILPLIGTSRMSVLEASRRGRGRRRCSSDARPGTRGPSSSRSRGARAAGPPAGPARRAERHDPGPGPRQAYGVVHGGGRRHPGRGARRDPRLPRPQRRGQDHRPSA